MATPRVLSFDVYGTLVDVRGGARAAFVDILAAVGADHVDPLDVWDHWEAANIRRYREPYETFARFGVRGDPALIRHYFDAFPSFPRFPDVDAVLDRLARDHPLAVVSNIDDGLLSATRLGRRFDIVCTAERAGGYKPDGTLFRSLLREAKVEAARLLHSGQSQWTDMVGAKPLGITVAWINRRALTLAPEVPRPDYEFRDLTSLPGVVGAA